MTFIGFLGITLVIMPCFRQHIIRCRPIVIRMYLSIMVQPNIQSPINLYTKHSLACVIIRHRHEFVVVIVIAVPYVLFLLRNIH